MLVRRVGAWLRSPKTIVSLALVVLLSGGVIVLNRWQLQGPTKITTTELKNVGQGHVTHGHNTSRRPHELQTNDVVTFESHTIPTRHDSANAAALQWQQVGDSGKISVQARTFDGHDWSAWTTVDQGDDRKDGTPVPHAALVLADQIHEIQYRFTLRAKGIKPSLAVNLDKTSIQLIDTSQGPSLDKPKTMYQKLFGWLHVPAAHAISSGPHVYSRSDWGCPEPNSSPRWTPEYAPLKQVIVHHTVTTQYGDSAATVRAIWYYHANTRGWGDIGYNYLVDRSGRVFMGRYYNPTAAQQKGGEVVGGHAYGHNVSTTGIAAIGTYTSADPTSAVLHSIAKIAAYKASPYGFNPVGGSKTIGHRNVYPTECPGDRLYGRLATIRQYARGYYDRYRSLYLYDYAYGGQGYNGASTNTVSFVSDTTGTMYIDLKNTGNYTWQNSGANQVRLGTYHRADHASVFRTDDWLSSNRPATFAQKVTSSGLEPTSTIAPGETARFSFTVKAPVQGGQYKEYFQPVREGVTWFKRDRGVYMQFNVTPKIYRWQWLGQAVYSDQTKTTSVDSTNLHAGQRVYFVVSAKNVGNQPWLNSGSNPVRLATSHPNDRTSQFCDSTWLSCNRPTGASNAHVDPGQSTTFEFWMKVPPGSTNITTREYFNLVAEGRRWMNDPGLYWDIQIK